MSNLKELPLGIQSFPELIEKNYLYIDKTAYIHRLVTKGKLYFLSRPRRFGKSVLVSTLEALFRGRRDLFEGLYIADRWDWQPRPVIRLDFLGIETHSVTMLEQELNDRLDEQAAAYGVTLSAPDSNDRLYELILELSKRGRVAVLIDEYDKPILDQITNQEQAEANRRFLATFYAVLKSLEGKLEFLLLTGVSKFTRVSLFSELNNLDDISLDSEYAGIAGYTQDEVDRMLTPYMQEAIDGLSGPRLKEWVRAWYNGYSWDGVTHVYNPVSLLSLLKKRRFSSYWFATGTPAFLLKLLRAKKTSIPALDQLEISELALDGFEPQSIDPIVLLFQTGYLTMQHITGTHRRCYQMAFPNLEVKEAFLTYILADYSGEQPGRTDVRTQHLGRHLIDGDIDAFFQGFQGLFASIPYNIFMPNREAYYHTVIYLVLSLLGMDTSCEVQTSKGRIDAVLETPDCFYITEFKMGTAHEAIAQIRDRDYAAAYRNRGKQVKLLGVGINNEKSNLDAWRCEDA